MSSSSCAIHKNYGSVPASQRDEERASPAFSRHAVTAPDPDRAEEFVFAGQSNMAFVDQWREEMGL